MKAIELKRIVRWSDADPAGIIYYPRIFDYVGECEWELLRSIGIRWEELKDDYLLPRVHVECSYKKVLKVGAAITIRLWPEALGRTSIKYGFEVFLDEAPDQAAVYGSVTSVVVRDGRAAEIPAAVRAALA
ncbi:MAG: acyl-CoA thioesterase [Acidobacteriota bacterium]|jgi:YbgC/YbaW family acyl-CoA thioester hydrolase|nr:acyl-CoA thioesterase [Acidobacteriota bacterium]